MYRSEFELHAKIEDVHWWCKARREIVFELIKRCIPPNQEKLIAEFGCGTGGNLKYLKRYYKVIGVDSNPDAVKFASGRVDCPVFLGDFREKLSCYWKDLQGVILADVLEHIEEDKLFLKDIVYKLNPLSIILVTVPAHQFLWSNHDIILGHKRRYSAMSFRKLWEDLPVSEVFFSPFNSFLLPIVFLWRILEIQKIKNKHKSDLALPSPVMNWVLYKIFSLERQWLRLSPLFAGVSYICVLKKNEIL